MESSLGVFDNVPRNRDVVNTAIDIEHAILRRNSRDVIKNDVIDVPVFAVHSPEVALAVAFAG